tara:strand:+ start:615 stop:1841 length:1227 start_codon:yes stop_codon:yes gene_type:complete
MAFNPLDYLTNLVPEGTNMFGASPNANMKKMYDMGLLGDTDYTDMLAKANKQSMFQGLLSSGLSYLAQPKNQGYGSALPYLAKAGLAGVQAAQNPFEQMGKDAIMNNQLTEMKRVNTDRNLTTESIDKFIKENPSYSAIKNLPITNQAAIMQDFYKPKPDKDPNVKLMAVQGLTAKYIKGGMPAEEAQNQAAIDVEMNPSIAIDLGQKTAGRVSEKAVDYFSGIQENINAGIPNATELAYASSMIDEAGSAQGFGGDSLEKIDALAQRFNIDLPGKEQKHYIRALKTAQIKLALGEKKPGTGPMTDKDFENFLNTTVQATNPKATNQIIAYVAQEKQKMQEEFGDAFEQEVNKNGFGTNVYSFERKYFQDKREDYISNIKNNIRKIIDQNQAPGADSGVLDIINNDLL